MRFKVVSAVVVHLLPLAGLLHGVSACVRPTSDASGKVAARTAVLLRVAVPVDFILDLLGAVLRFIAAVFSLAALLPAPTPDACELVSQSLSRAVGDGKERYRVIES